MRGLVLICILHPVSAAPKRHPLARHIPSFISPPIKHDRLTTKSDLPLLIRGGQQLTLTARQAHFDVSVLGSSPFIQYNSILATVNLLGLGISLASRKQYHLDLLGTGAFALASILTASGFVDAPLRVHISSVAVALWSVKLAAFLFYRACKVKTDARLEGLLSSVSGTGKLKHRRTLSDAT